MSSFFPVYSLFGVNVLIIEISTTEVGLLFGVGDVSVRIPALFVKKFHYEQFP